jgi:hypothetical protein
MSRRHPRLDFVIAEAFSVASPSSSLDPPASMTSGRMRIEIA